MNIITQLLYQLNEDVDISQITTKIIPQYIPKEKWSKAFNDIIERHGKSKFNNLTIDDMFKDPSEGWFFHYSKYKNKYFESQYSFQFVVGFKFENLNIKAIYDDDITWNNGNFMVDSINKQIIIEKTWTRERLAAGHIEDIDEVKTALSIALKLHPEIIDYKFNYPRMGLKKVSDVLNISSVGEGDSDIIVFWGTTEDGLRIANKSKYENITCWFDTVLAKGEIKVYQYNNPVETGRAVVKLKFNSNDKRLIKNNDGSIGVSYITKSDIVSYKASKDFDINKEILYKKFDKYKFLKELNIQVYKVDDWEDFKSNYPKEYKDHRGYKENFRKNNSIYRVVNNDVAFFAAPSNVSDDEIIFSLCIVEPDIFMLRNFNLISFDSDEAHKTITQFILNKNINSIINILIKNIFEDRVYKIEKLDQFIERVEEFLSKG